MFGISSGDENDFEDLLDKLQQDGWLNRKQDIQAQQIDISFKMHPLVQDVVKEKLKPGADNCFTLIDSLSSIMKEHLTVAWHYISYAQSVTDQVKPVDGALALLNLNLSDTYRNIGNLPQALATVEIAKKGFEDSGEEYKLSVCYERLGVIHQALGQLKKALEFFEMDIKLTKELYQANPKNVDLKDGMAISFYKLADIYLHQKQKKKAKELFSKALNIWKQLFKSTNINKYKDYIDNVPKTSNRVGNNLNNLPGTIFEPYSPIFMLHVTNGKIVRYGQENLRKVPIRSLTIWLRSPIFWLGRSNVFGLWFECFQ